MIERKFNPWVNPNAVGWLQFAPASVAPAPASGASPIIIEGPRWPPVDESNDEEIARLASERDRLKREIERIRNDATRLEVVEGSAAGEDAGAPVIVRAGPWTAKFVGAPIVGVILKSEIIKVRKELEELV